MVYNGVGFGLREVLSLRPCGPSLPLWRKRHLPRPGGVCLAEGGKRAAASPRSFLGSLWEGAAARRRLRERASPLPEVFLYYAAGWLSVSVESVPVLSLSAVDSDAMMSVTWLEPSRFSFFCASSASAIRPPICWMFGSVAV